MPTPIAEAVALHEQALAGWDEHRFRDAADLCRRALERFEAHAGPAHPDVANVLSLLGSIEDELVQFASAERHHRRAVAIACALPPGSAVLVRLRVNAHLGLAGNLRRQGRYAEAELACLAALAQAGPDDRPGIYNELGVLYKFAGRLDEAAAAYDSARVALVEAYGADDPALAPLWHNLAGLARSRGEFAAGEVYARRALHLYRQNLEADHPEVLAHRHNLAAVLADQGRTGEAAATYRRVLAGKRRVLGPDHPEVAVTEGNLAALLVP